MCRKAVNQSFTFTWDGSIALSDLFGGATYTKRENRKRIDLVWIILRPCRHADGYV